MSGADYSVGFQNLLSASSTNMAVGDVVCLDSTGRFVIANTANLAAAGGGIPLGVLRTVGNPLTAVHVQYNGIVPPAVSGLSDGDLAFATVDANGRLSRTSTASPLTMGRVTENGTVALWGTPGMSAGVISGQTDLAIASGPIAIGDLVTSALDTNVPLKMTLATEAALDAGGSIEGVAVTAANDGEEFTRALPGSKLAPDLTELVPTTTRTTVVADGSGRCEAKQVPGFDDYVAGYADTEGIMHFIPSKSRVGEFAENVWDFGALGLDPATAVTTEIQAAADVAWTNTGDAAYPNYKPLHIPPGVHRLTQPIRMNKSDLQLRGSGRENTILLPAFRGPTIICGPDDSANPAVVTGGPFSGNCFYPENGGNDYYFDLTQVHCADVSNFGTGLDGLEAFCISMWIYVPTGSEASGGDQFIFAGSLGTEQDPVVSGYDHAFLLYYAGDQGIYNNDGIILAHITIDGTVRVLHAEDYPIAPDTWTHVALDFDGTTVRLLVNGTVAATGPYPGAITQMQWEATCLGSARLGFSNAQPFGTFPGKIGPVRIQDASIYSAAVGTYTPPAAAFTPAFSDIFVCNWDQVIHNDVVGASFRAIDQVWMPPHNDTVDLFALTTNIRISDLTVYANASVAGAGGIWMRGCVSAKISRFGATLTHFGVVSVNNSYFCRHEDIHVNGSNQYVGILDMTTGGNTWSNCQSENHFYNYFFGGGVTLDKAMVGAWTENGAGIAAWNSYLSLKSVFWDAESQNFDSRGALYATGLSVIKMDSSCLPDVGPLFDHPTVTIDGCDMELEGAATSYAPQTVQIEILRDPPNPLRIGWQYAVAPNGVITTNTTTRIHMRDRLFGGEVTHDFTADTDYTATADQFTYRTMYFTDSGVALTDARSVILPTLAGEWRHVCNNTLQSLTFTTELGAGVTVATTDHSLIYCDGTDWVVMLEVTAGGGGGGTPGGSDRQVQFNDVGTFGGATNVTYTAGGLLAIAAAGALTLGTTPATAGLIRAPNNSIVLSVRNAANDANITWLTTDGSNNLYFGNTANGGLSFIRSPSQVDLAIAGTSRFQITGTTATFTVTTVALGSSVLTQGSTVAGAGDFRVKNAWTLQGRNAGNSANATILEWDASNDLSVGDGTDTSRVLLLASSQVVATIGATARLRVAAACTSVLTTNLSVGSDGPTFNSATNSIFVADGTQPSTHPTAGVYISSDSGKLRLRSSNDPASGVQLNMVIHGVSGGFSTLDPDHGILVTIDKQGAAASTRWIPLYSA